MKPAKILATILTVSLALPMCACKPKSNKDPKNSSGESSSEASSSQTETETDVPTDSSTETEPTVGPTVPASVTDDSEDPIVIYGYDKDFKAELTEYLQDIEFEYVYVEPENYIAELKKAMSSEEKQPDLFMMDAEHLPNFTDSGYTVGIEQVGISRADLSDQFEYTYKAATDRDYSIKALAVDLAPTAIIYNRKLAKDMLGSADPATVSPMLSDWDALLKYAREVSMNSEGMLKLFADRQQIGRFFWVGRNVPWVVDGKVTISEDFDKYFDLQKSLFDQSLTLEFTEGSEEWTRAINDGQCVMFFGSLETAANVIGYVPGHTEPEEDPKATEPAATGETTEGTTTEPEETGWSIVPAPKASYDGGTWLMVSSVCDKKATAGKILKTLTMDASVMTDMAVKGRFVNSRTIMEKCAQDPNFASDFLSGQNPYTILVPEAERIVIPDDPAVEKCAEAEIWHLLNAFMNGEIETMEEVKQQFTVGMEELLGLS